MESEPTAQEIQEKVEECASFLRTVLRPDFDLLSRAVSETKQEIADYTDLKQRLEKLHQDKNAPACVDTNRVDLGHQKVFCRAIIDDYEHVYVHIGEGFHVELTIPEALEYLKKRINLLSSSVLPHRDAKVQKVLAHIQSSEMILDQLSKELAKSS